MKTGIIGAMSVEVEALKAEMTDKATETVSGIEFVSGKLCGKEVVVAQCGVGKVFAALCAQTMILKYGVDRVINTGVAGSLSDKLAILDVAVATEVVQHDMDTSPLGDPVGLISGINIVKIPACKSLCDEIAEAAEANGTLVNRLPGIPEQIYIDHAFTNLPAEAVTRWETIDHPYAKHLSDHRTQYGDYCIQ